MGFKIEEAKIEWTFGQKFLGERLWAEILWDFLRLRMEEDKLKQKRMQKDFNEKLDRVMDELAEKNRRLNNGLHTRTQSGT